MKHRSVLAVLVLTAVLALSFALVGCSSKGDASSSAGEATSKTASPSTNSGESDNGMTQASELLIEDITVGTGAEATAGRLATVHYTGWLTNGVQFDSSLSRNKPYQFIVGAGDVIAGWDQGVAGMKVGGKRKLTIPAELAYGNRAVGAIPAGSTLVFEVELLEVQ